MKRLMNLIFGKSLQNEPQIKSPKFFFKNLDKTRKECVRRTSSIIICKFKKQKIILRSGKIRYFRSHNKMPSFSRFSLNCLLQVVGTAKLSKFQEDGSNDSILFEPTRSPSFTFVSTPLPEYRRISPSGKT